MKHIDANPKMRHEEMSLNEFRIYMNDRIKSFVNVTDDNDFTGGKWVEMFEDYIHGAVEYCKKNNF